MKLIRSIVVIVRTIFTVLIFRQRYNYNYRRYSLKNHPICLKLFFTVRSVLVTKLQFLLPDAHSIRDLSYVASYSTIRNTFCKFTNSIVPSSTQLIFHSREADNLLQQVRLSEQVDASDANLQDQFQETNICNTIISLYFPTNKVDQRII